ncbi:wwm1p [Saccharomyces arboricola H-6]|uniref:Wwm1p n=1 Tax=Saccharomyces arboricola (strain H-6 / AS 2.3317 / CBS 10644) TaxID=1160507 RepID=J8Q8J2_SACAR|nr:wwm1p [Saccharomyces arboricola H-6]
MAQSKSNPPQVPSGWKAVFDDEYQTWFYVDLSTNNSQWEPPKGASFPRPKGPPPAANNEKTSRQQGDQAPPPYSAQSRTQPQPQAQQAQQGRYYQPQQPQYPQQPQQQSYYPQQVPMAAAAAPQQGYYGATPTAAKSSGRSGAMMGGLLGVGAGLLGGAMLEHAFDDHSHGGPGPVVENNYYGDDNGGGFGGPFDGGFDGEFDGGFDGGDF